jgi:hypothetical protein
VDSRVTSGKIKLIQSYFWRKKMKKLVLALIVALTLAPFSAFGLEMMTDDNLKETTAQAGVVIALDDVTLVQHSQMTTMYIDDDGHSANDASITDAAAGLQIRDMGESKRTIRINALYNGTAGVPMLAPLSNTPIDNWGLSTEAGWGIINHKYAYGVEDGFLVQQALTIDIGKCPILSAGMTNLKTYEIAPGKDLQAIITDLGSATGVDFYQAYDLGTYLHMTKEDFNEDSLVNIVGINITLPTVEIDQQYTKHCKEISVRLVAADTAHPGAYNAVVRDDGGSGEALDYTIDTTATAGYINAKGVDNLIKIQKDGFSTLAITSGKLEIAPK